MVCDMYGDSRENTFEILAVGFFPKKIRVDPFQPGFFFKISGWAGSTRILETRQNYPTILTMVFPIFRLSRFNPKPIFWV